MDVKAEPYYEEELPKLSNDRGPRKKETQVEEAKPTRSPKVHPRNMSSIKEPSDPPSLPLSGTELDDERRIALNPN